MPYAIKNSHWTGLGAARADGGADGLPQLCLSPKLTEVSAPVSSSHSRGFICHIDRLRICHRRISKCQDPTSQKYVTISTRKGLYQFNRLPFGVASAPAIKLLQGFFVDQKQPVYLCI